MNLRNTRLVGPFETPTKHETRVGLAPTASLVLNARSLQDVKPLLDNYAAPTKPQKGPKHCCSLLHKKLLVLSSIEGGPGAWQSHVRQAERLLNSFLTRLLRSFQARPTYGHLVFLVTFSRFVAICGISRVDVASEEFDRHNQEVISHRSSVCGGTLVRAGGSISKPSCGSLSFFGCVASWSLFKTRGQEQRQTKPFIEPKHCGACCQYITYGGRVA